MALVKQYLQLVIIVLLLLAVFGVLLTPDTNDDPAGVMVRLEKGRLLAAPVLITQIVSLPPLAATTPILFSRTHVSTSVAKLDLICSRLC